MQTFLPYADFVKTAQTLDRQRLGKQRVETLQILSALSDATYGWQNHPAVKMWRGYQSSLFLYQEAICAEWVSRGYNDTCLEKSRHLVQTQCYDETQMPPWLGDEKLHLSHRSNLLRKNATFYAPLFEDGLQNDIEYYWPTGLLLTMREEGAS